jgi:hypothetical protein
MVLFQNCVWWSRPLTKMAAQLYLVIGSYVKLNSAVGAILVEGPNCLTYFWKRTIQ